MWTIGLSLLLWFGNKWVGVFAIALALGTNWARVFVGVHFPFDMVGALLVSLVAILLVQSGRLLFGYVTRKRAGATGSSTEAPAADARAD